MTDPDLLAINTIRTLSMDAVQAANSGHPGTPMGMAAGGLHALAGVPPVRPRRIPIWPNRDRFVLSIGHASMLLYSMLHLAGVKSVNRKYEILGTPSVSIDDIKKFRQLDSKTPGHPEYRLTSGVETTTGPLGQGVATSVGMAIGSKWLAARLQHARVHALRFRRVRPLRRRRHDGRHLVRGRQPRGHLKLSNLCWIYDSNRITIDGSTDDHLHRGHRLAIRRLRLERPPDRRRQRHPAAPRRRYTAFQNAKDRPTFILVHSNIGYGSSKQDTNKAHGAPAGRGRDQGVEGEVRLDRREVRRARRRLRHASRTASASAARSSATPGSPSSTSTAPPIPAEADAARQASSTASSPTAGTRTSPTFPADAKGIAGRKASSKVEQVVAKNVPWLIGGSADLNESTFTDIEGAGSVRGRTATAAGTSTSASASTRWRPS